MATGLSSYLANSFLDALGNNTSFAVTTVYVKLHTGDPGANGTANAATETTRKSVSFAAASSGSIASDADITWTNIAGSQDATFLRRGIMLLLVIFFSVALLQAIPILLAILMSSLVVLSPQI